MNLTQEDWWNKLQSDENAVILDVRTEDEWNDGIIPNAINIDIYKGQGFIYQVEELDKSKNYYVYCKAGGRSAQACSIMSQMGFETTYNLMGGFSEWSGPTDMPK
ncbi:rhodanese-like domain-containing protein [Flavobacterium sp.]|uniref:rhodanese-like domain-containing protein n=1 Tax=Flavobacterium sp. TaxID=239 RepID=UPI003D6C2263